METVTTQIRTITAMHPWIGRVLNRLPKVFSDTLPNGGACPTMATNGKAIFINPAFVDSLAEGHVRGILVHEAIHVIQRHPLRRGRRDPELYGIAIDAATNALVYNLGYRLPANRVPEVHDQTVEQIYNVLAANQPPSDNSESTSDSSEDDADENSQGDDSQASDSQDENDDENGDSSQPGDEANSESDGDKGENGPEDVAGDGSSQSTIPSNTGTDDCMDYPLAPGETMQDAERAIDALVAEAKLDVELAGCSSEVTAIEKAYVFQHTETDLNWPRELEEYIHLIGGADYSMNPPHMGLAQQGIICNQLNPVGCGNVILAIDVSGSIDHAKLDLAISHLMLFVENMDYESLRVIACSARIRFDRTFYRGETVDVSEMPTGGGTSFMPVFDLVNEGNSPDLLIYFTDMMTNDMHESDDPGYPIIWLVDCEGYIDATGEWTYGGNNPRKRNYYFTPAYGHRIDACQ